MNSMVGDGQPALAYKSVNPATGEVVGSYATATDEMIADSLTAGDTAYAAWRARSIAERAAVVRRIGELFVLRSDELARLATAEMGKSITEARGEVEFSGSIFTYYAEHGADLLADQAITSFSGGRAVIQKLPIGLLLGVMPWNYPYYQVARFAAPNLIAGNTILLKHAESVPECARAIQEIMDEAGLPVGVYQNVFASHEQVERIIADSRVQGVSLTGSERAGSAVAAIAGKHLKKCVLELGGSDPYIVLDTDDVAKSAEAAWRTRMSNTGQACNSNKRLIVADDLFDDFVTRLTELARSMRPGNPLEPNSNEYPPMSSRDAAERLAEVIREAVEQGATLHAGGELGPAPTAYLSPAVLTGVTKQMRAYREELFGPVAVVYRVSTDDDALRLANDTEFGLGGAVFSADEKRALEVAARLEVGMANVNIFAGEGPEIPFGGVKRSGFGRELGPLGIDEFVNKRLLYIK